MSSNRTTRAPCVLRQMAGQVPGRDPVISISGTFSLPIKSRRVSSLSVTVQRMTWFPIIIPSHCRARSLDNFVAVSWVCLTRKPSLDYRSAMAVVLYIYYSWDYWLIHDMKRVSFLDQFDSKLDVIEFGFV